MPAPVSWMCALICLAVIVAVTTAGSDDRSLTGSTWKSFVRSYVEKSQQKLDVNKQLSEKENELIGLESFDRAKEQTNDVEPTENAVGEISRIKKVFDTVTGYRKYPYSQCKNIQSSLSRPGSSTYMKQSIAACIERCESRQDCNGIRYQLGTTGCILLALCSPMNNYAFDVYMKNFPNNCAFLNGGCDHICTDDEYADDYTCSCHTGYQLTADSHTCNKDDFEELGECASKNGGCAHVCIVTPGGHMCTCHRGYRLYDDGKSCSPDVIPVEGEFIDCAELFNAGYISTGVYNIKPYGLGSTTNVFCDQETEGGGWTVFQRRLDGMENFYRNWNDYKNGFGSLYSEFWMGLDILYLMVTENCDDMILRVELEGFQNEVAFAEYDDFTIGNEEDGFTLHIDRSEAAYGLSEDAMYLHNNLKFYTYDESHGEENLAERFQGGWWYRDSAIHKTCVYACLNQRYYNYQLSWNPYAITWHNYRYKHHSWKTTAMKFRPSNFCANRRHC